MLRGIARQEETIRRVALLSLLYCLPLLITLQAVVDPDIWWHLRTGQWMVEQGRVPTTDPFSQYGMGKPWVAYSWLVELLMYGLYEAFGLMGLVLYRVVLCLLVVGMVHWFVCQRESHFPRQITLTVVGVLGLLPILNPRSWLFSILFFILEIDLLLKARQTGQVWRLWLLPPLFALWANIHIQFIYGLLALGLAVIEPLLMNSPLLSRCRHAEPNLSFGSLLAVMVLCLAATLLTPHGFSLYGTILEVVTRPVLFQLISELQPLHFRGVWEWFVFVVILGGAIEIRQHWDGKPFLPLLLLFGVMIAFRATRDRWMVIVPALAVLTTMGPVRSTVDHFVLTKLRIGVVGGVVLVVSMLVSRGRDLSAERLWDAVAARYPDAAARFIEQRGYTGPLFNHFNWGGYLIWRLPHLPVSMDGRIYNIYSDERLRRNFRTWKGEGGWASDPDLVAAQVILSAQGSQFTSLLRLDDRFEVAYEDRLAAVFVPTARQNSEGNVSGKLQ